MEINLIPGSWLFIQCTLLVVHYGFDKTLPWWVLWLPSLIALGILSLMFFGFIIMIIVGVIND